MREPVDSIFLSKKNEKLSKLLTTVSFLTKIEPPYMRTSLSYIQ